MKAVIPLLLLALGAPFAVGEGESVRDKSLDLVISSSQYIGKDTAPAPKKLPKPESKELEIKSIDEAEAILTMPEYKVSARPLHPIEIRLNKLAPVFALLDRQQRAELKKTEPTVLDEILNHPIFSIFGAETAEARAAKARARIDNMDIERMLLFALAQAETSEDKAEIQSLIVDLREMRR